MPYDDAMAHASASTGAASCRDLMTRLDYGVGASGVKIFRHTTAMSGFERLEDLADACAI